MGQIGSIAKRVLERMDAFLDETDEAGRMPSYGKVVVAAIVGNEDGAHFSSAQLFQASTMWAGQSPRLPPAIGGVKRWDRAISTTWKTHPRWSRRPRKCWLATLPTWQAY